jgi:hypothetical protein
VPTFSPVVWLFGCALLLLSAISGHAQINCSALINGDSQRPAVGAHAYARLGSAQGRDERCEGRIVELHAGSAGLVVHTFTVGQPETTLASAAVVNVKAPGLTPGKRGHVSVFGHATDGPYRMDLFVDTQNTSRWPLAAVAKQIRLDWQRLRAVGRVVEPGVTRPVFFPVAFEASGVVRSADDLVLRVRSTENSRQISAFVGSYSGTGDCRPEQPAGEWTHVGSLTDLPISLTNAKANQFCVYFLIDRLGTDGAPKQEPAALYFIR